MEGSVARQGLDPASRRCGRGACFHGWKQADGLFPSISKYGNNGPPCFRRPIAGGRRFSLVPEAFRGLRRLWSASSTIWPRPRGGCQRLIRSKRSWFHPRRLMRMKRIDDLKNHRRAGYSPADFDQSQPLRGNLTLKTRDSLQKFSILPMPGSHRRGCELR